MNNKKITDMYVNGRYTLRHLADIFSTNHHKIKRILLENGAKITRRNTLKEFTKTHREKISKTRKTLYDNGIITTWSKGKKMTREHNIKNMKGHLKYDISFEWLNKFEDIEKLKYLNKSITRTRDKKGFTTEIYKLFIEKFYYDKKFNYLFDEWKKTENKWIKPSLDHIQAKSKLGKLDNINNLQFISWLENRAKIDISQDKWNEIKKNIGYYL